jgi:hypothetical protein
MNVCDVNSTATLQARWRSIKDVTLYGYNH